MYRFVLVLCLVIALFDWRVDTVQARACVDLRVMPDALPGWCAQAPPATAHLSRVAGSVARAAMRASPPAALIPRIPPTARQARR